MEYKLTQYSHGAGCGCKIAPSVLEEIIHTDEKIVFDQLLVGNSNKDDAAVFDLGNGEAVISTTDFFMPIVDDPYDFGRIASVNAISDIYAMGGTPLMAISILGWPVNTLPASVAKEVTEGARAVCKEAGIPLAGGHSIDSPEPIFGLAVTGRLKIENLKKNEGAKAGDKLFLTKGLGIGIFTTAQKKGLLQPEHEKLAKDSMLRLNKLGELFGRQEYIHAMTDVTGFGLMGHLLEMCQASGVSAEVRATDVPLLDADALHDYLAKECVPGGTNRNWKSYGDHIGIEVGGNWQTILSDPQTSGGLLVAVDPTHEEEFIELVKPFLPRIQSIGSINEVKEGKIVRVI